MRVLTYIVFSIIASVNSATQEDQNGKKTISEYIEIEQCQIDHGKLKIMLDRMLHKKRYDPRIRPNFEERRPVDVGLNLYVAGIDEVSEMKMDYTLTVYFLQKWRDPRLVLDPNGEFGPLGWLDNCSLALSSVVEADIWVPDVFFVNEKSSFRHTVTMMNTMVRLYPDGNVFYSIRITMKLVCPMQMHKYPLDEQNCSLIMESYSHSDDEMTLYLMSNEALGVNSIDNSINGLKDLSLQQFEIQQASVMRTLHTQNDFTNHRITLKFWLRRRITYFLLQSYVPCTLITILSWVSFWINYEATAARVSLGITTVMTMTTIYTHVSAGMPKIPDLKALDVYMLACFVFVFMALLEYAVVNYSFYGRRRMLSRQRHSQMLEKSEESHDYSDSYGSRIRTCRDSSAGERTLRQRSVPNVDVPQLYRRDAKRLRRFKALSVCDIKDVSVIDEFSRRAFPISFIVFNIIYWTYYKTDWSKLSW